MSQNSRAIASLNKTFNNFSKDNRKIPMTQDLTKFVNNIPIKIRLANPLSQKCFRSLLNFEIKSKLRLLKFVKYLRNLFILAVALFE
jgi:hypothetical protein